MKEAMAAVARKRPITTSADFMYLPFSKMWGTTQYISVYAKNVCGTKYKTASIADTGNRCRYGTCMANAEKEYRTL
jgi:hypothetical protein